MLVELDLDGSGTADIGTGVPFFDHMLAQLAKHGLLDLSVRATGNIEVDAHHTVEDTALTLGQALRRHSATRRASAASGTPPCRWMRRWPGPRSTCPGGRTWCTQSRTGWPR